MSDKKNNNVSVKLKQVILNYFNNNTSKISNYKQVCKDIGVTKTQSKKRVDLILKQMAIEKLITQVDRGKYRSNIAKSYVEGILDFTSRGAAFLMNENFATDIRIPEGSTLNSLNGDEVKVLVTKITDGIPVGGKVVEVIKRNKTTFVGVLEKSPKFAFCVIDNKKIHVDFYVDLKDTLNAQNGEKVLVEITRWPTDVTSPFAKVIKVLGAPGETDTEVHSILEDYDLPYEFPENVLSFANKIPLEISTEEIALRRDMRGITTLTIDPIDAKDFDDALSFQELDNGNYEIGIHIADVSHYMKKGSILDIEAYKRATSVYLVDRVVPMLPEVLSNQVCSLRPNEDKLTFSAVFEIDSKANVKKEWFGRTVIHSDRRFTYEEAQERIETKEGDFEREINILNDLARIIRKARLENGALGIETEETRFSIDENGNPTGVYVKKMREANQLIEEFMLLANKRVAFLMGNPEKNPKKIPFPYRVHDLPDEVKINEFKMFTKDMGYHFKPVKNKPLSYAINQILEEAKEKGELAIIGPVAIRAMAKAVYSTENIGHYGLAFDYYAHFTSPIRRYPDVVVHRVLQSYLNKEFAGQNEKQMEADCKHFSKQERMATDAERASIKFMQVKYMGGFIGEEFDGKISGAMEHGFFVEIIENKCEGFIKARDLNDDYYIFDSNKKSFTGKKYGFSYKIGQQIRVKIISADLQKRQIDMELIDMD